MTMDRERTSDDLFKESSDARAQLAEVTRRLCWFVDELQQEIERQDQEPNEPGR